MASPNEIGGGAAPASTGTGPGAGLSSPSPRCSPVMTFSSVRSATRSITFDSSRTLPGHGWASRRSRASAARIFTGRP